MGDHLKADLERIGTTATDLRFLQTEFSSAGQIVDDYRGYLGSGELANRLDDFVDNWTNHRRWLCESIEGVARAAEAAVQAYKGVDGDLTAALLDAFEGDGG